MQFPTALETLAVNKAATTAVGPTDHPQHHNDLARIVNALQTKVGIDSSAVTTTHDYKLSEVTSTDKAVGKTATQTLTNKTLTSPVITNKSSTGTDSGTETLANKTLTTPTIADLSNMTHDHQSNSKGGTLNAAAIAAGTIATARLGSGTANSGSYLRGDQTWQPIEIEVYVGDGSDGAVNLDGTNTFAFLSKSGNNYTMTRDMYATTITIGTSCALITNGYIPYASVEMTGSGTLKWGTPNAGGNASGTTAGTAGAANSSGGKFYLNYAGAAGSNNAGSNGNASTSVITSIGSRGGSGGNAGGDTRSGGASGTVTAPISNWKMFKHLLFLGADFLVNATFAILQTGSGGGGGAGGYNSGAGGGGGASGGIVMFFAKLWSGTFTIDVAGANGGNSSTTGNGGGGGGGGGAAVAAYYVKTWTGSYNLAGGTAGTGASNSAPGNGTAGVSYEIDMDLMTQ